MQEWWAKSGFVSQLNTVTIEDHVTRALVFLMSEQDCTHGLVWVRCGNCAKWLLSSSDCRVAGIGSCAGRSFSRAALVSRT